MPGEPESGDVPVRCCNGEMRGAGGLGHSSGVLQRGTVGCAGNGCSGVGGAGCAGGGSEGKAAMLAMSCGGEMRELSRPGL